MKKLIAAALALLMLLASAACAESAKVMTWSEPSLQLTTDGKSREVDLSSLSLRLAAGTPGDVPTVQAEMAKKGKVVARGLVQLVNDKIYIEADGLSRTYMLDLSKLGGQAQSSANRLFAGLDHLLDFKLPAFGGVKIPMVDMTLVAPLVGALPTTDAEGKKSAQIQVPYLMIKQLLSMANRYRDSVPASAQAYVGPLFELVDRMVQSDSGFALKGRVATNTQKKRSAITLDIYPVQGGVTAGAPTAKVKVVSRNNAVDVTVDMYQGESTVNMAAFSLSSDPGDAALDVSLDVMSLFLVSGSLRNDGDAQVVALNVNSLGQKFSVDANYGTVGDMDYVNLTLKAPNRLDLSASLQASDDGRGGSEGTFAVNAQLYDDTVTGIALTGDVAEGREDVDFRKVRKIDGAVDLLHMTGDQQKQLTRELDSLVDKFLSRSNIGKR